MVSQPRAPRVVLVGERAPNGITGSFARAFRSCGWEVVELRWGPWRPGALAVALFRAPSLAGGFRRQLRRRVAAAGAAELVLVVKGPFLDARTIDWMRTRTGAPVVCWNPDDPLGPALSNQGGIARAVPAYDTYVVWADDVAERLAARAARVEVIPFGFDPWLHHPPRDRSAAEGRVVFVGAWDPEREAVMRSIAHHAPVVFGDGWPSGLPFETRPAAFGEDLCAALGGAAWSINLLRPQNRRSHNMRSFEIPACGGVQLAVRTADHERHLAGTPCVLVESEEDFDGVLKGEPPVGVVQPGWLEANRYEARIRQLLRALGLEQGGGGA